MVAGSPHIKKKVLSKRFYYRYDTVKMAIKDYSDFEISDYEIQKQG